MKVRGNGQAKVLSQEEIIALLKAISDHNPRHGLLFAICLFTGCRISEALRLEVGDIKGGIIVFRKQNTKGKLQTRSVTVNEDLQKYLDLLKLPQSGAIFPGRRGQSKFMSRGHADRILRNACKALKIEGVSTHSFRRSALTLMHRSGIPLGTIRKISGHADLGTLQKYLEISEDEIKIAVNTIKVFGNG